MALKFVNNLLLCAVSVLFISCVVGFDNIRLTEDGGYDIVVAVEQGTIQPDDVDLFVENINIVFQNLSALMYTATREKFYVHSVDLVLPYHWQLQDNDGAVTKNSYENADIRLSTSFEAPHVENPNVCTLPGHFIELPFNFFDQIDGQYGPLEKLLLTAWARYRYGVHDEHGYVTDKRFPYFYKNPGDILWKATGCSNDELLGDYLSLNGNEEDCQLDDHHYPPRSPCRFVPKDEEGIQRSNSSLMYFHWIDSVTEFCDQDTHDKEPPNKQNILCGYKSILEVMEETLDFNMVKTALAEMPPMKFVASSATKLPRLYLLVDGGRFNIGSDDKKDILDNIKSLFNNQTFTDVLGTAAVFFTDKRVPKLDVKLNLEKVGVNIDKFETVVNEFISEEDYDTGNFALALQEVIQTVRAQSHLEGAIIFVLKHGSSNSAFDGSVYESDLMTILKEENIRLHAIEIQTNNMTPKIHLEKLAIESGGYHLALKSDMDVAMSVRKSVREVIDKLSSMESEPSHVVSSGTLFKGFVRENATFLVPLDRANLPPETSVRLSITLDRNAPFDFEKPLIVKADGPEQAEIDYESEELEWNDVGNGLNRKVITYDMTAVQSSFSTDWKFTYDGCIAPASDPNICNAFIVVSYDLPKDSVSTGSSNALAPNLAVQVWTSTAAVNEVINLDPDEVNQIPFIVFAKITQNGSPVYGAQVRAMLHNFDKNEMSSLPPAQLRDDGASSVDITAQDGIYSGSVHVGLLDDTMYRLMVEVSGRKLEIENEDTFFHMDSAVQRIIPVDQTSIGCRSSSKACSVTGLDRNVAFLVDYERMIQVTQFPSFVARIADLDIEAKNDFNVRLTWRVPVFHDNIPLTKLIYDIRGSDNGDDLKTTVGFESTQSYDVKSTDIISFVPGELCQVTLNPGNDQPIYFAVRLFADTLTIQAEPSNVVGVVPVEVEITTTTTTSTMSPPTTEDIPTRPPETTTEEFVSVSSSTASTTTKEPHDGYWYESTEGIITLSVFGTGLLIIAIAALVYFIYSSRVRQNRRMPTEGLPSYDSFN